MAKDQSSKPADDQTGATGESAEDTLGKGRPTPSRKQAQAAKAQPLVGGRDKAAQKEFRQRQNEARERARVGMMQGDERYLTARDKGPQRRYVRDYVDARFSLGEFTIPLMLLVLLMSLLPGQIQVYSIIAIWSFLFLAIIDAVILGFRLRGKLAAKFGADKIQPGFRWYAAMRAFQFRMLRAPKPQVKRLKFPE
ncbi:MAG: DUF3043 domain-containing protein [Actinobacteria bacterium]|nr:DUF3043 domain-containing protein [Actinomycetota bacterium]